MIHFSIRDAGADDVEDIVALVNAAYRPQPGAEGWTHEAALVSGPRVTGNHLLEALANSHVLVACYASKLIGSVQISAMGKDANIGMLAVQPSMQGSGLGKALLVEAERYAIEQLDVERFLLYVVAGRDELTDFYKRRGYCETGDFQAYPMDAGVGMPFEPSIRLAVLQKPAIPSGAANGGAQWTRKE